MRSSRRKQGPHESALIKRGVGQHIYLMFAGRIRDSDDASLTGKPHGVQKLLPIVLLLGVACMIGIVLWRQMSAMR